MPINSRNKGAAFERQIASIIKDELGLEVKRNLDQYQSKGCYDLVGLHGYALELKRYASITDSMKRTFWKQALEQTGEYEEPILIYKADRQETRVVMLANDGLFDDEDYNGTIDVSLHYFLALVRESMN